MKRKIVKIDEEKCTGCGICINACHEGALQIVNGKAKLISESYCDGLGACLPNCPEGAIVIEEREAESFDENAVKKHIEAKNNIKIESTACGCPGAKTRVIAKKSGSPIETKQEFRSESQLNQWPCQIKLVAPNAPYFENADILVAADCTAYAYANIHSDFMRNKVTIIGCPKLDDMNYADKLTDILKYNDIKSITVLRMEVPCCGGIVNAVKQSLLNSQKMIPWHVVTISIDGKIIDQN